MTEAPPHEFIMESWDGQRVYDELRQSMDSTEAIRELNLLAAKLPWYPANGGSGGTIYTGARIPPPAMGSVTWRLAEGEKVELVLPSGSIIAAKEAIFRTLPDAVRAQWSKPAGQKSSRGRKSKYDWVNVDAELIRLIVCEGIPIEDDAPVARKLLDWCGENWPDFPGERYLRGRVKTLLDPTRADLAKPLKPVKSASRPGKK